MVLDLLLPPTCPVCLRTGEVLCAPCRSGLLPAPALGCPAGVDRLWSLLAYEGAGRQVVTALKYRGMRGLVRPLARAMADLVGPDADAVDVVTWIPTSTARRRARGFDQAALLARPVAATLGRPLRRLLERGPGPAQTGRSRAERLDGPRLSCRPAAGSRVLVVDDVVTTGATLEAAAGALRGSGAIAVTALTAARTP